MPPSPLSPALAGSLPAHCRGGRGTRGLCLAYQVSLPRAPASLGAGGGSACAERMTLIPGPPQPRQISSFRVPAAAREAPGAYTAVGALRPGQSP